MVERLRSEDSHFHVDGGSWTNDISWVQGYDCLLVPMEMASSLFHERVLARGIHSDEFPYRNALFHLLAAETSCYRELAGVATYEALSAKTKESPVLAIRNAQLSAATSRTCPASL